MKRSSEGFSMVEVLVSVLVLSIGLLGLAGLQASSLRNSQSAYFRSQATEMAYDIADRMRANLAGASTAGGQLYDNTGKTSTSDNGHESEYDSEHSSTEASCETNACSPSEVAAYDVKAWGDHLVILPGGGGWICLDSTPNDGATVDDPGCDGAGSVYAIKIWWDDSRSGEAKQRFVASFQP
jgi:type IV pilus assembly protein PilV